MTNFSDNVHEIIHPTKEAGMWQSIANFLREWQARPSGYVTLGIVAGMLLLLIGVIWNVPRERKMGAIVVVVCVLAGIVAYFYG